MADELRSAIVGKGYQPGNDGFYFQHRKGRLDMRAISKIDLDSIVRNVDIESLQEHLENLCFAQLLEQDIRQYTDPMILKLFRVAQYTIEYLLHVQEQLASTLNSLAAKYAKKKRELLEKRQEISSLKALSASLQSEVEAKKKSLLILEEMIKDVGKPKALEAPAEVLPETTVAKFFVAGPKGVCVEFSVSSSSAVRDVLRDAKCAFRSQRRGGRGDPTARLMYQGRWLLEDMTVKDCGIRSGDTLVYAEEKPEDDEPKTEEVMLIGDKARSGAVLSKGGAEDLVKTQSEAYRRIADELKTSFEAALKSLAQREKAEAPPSESLLRLDEKWTRVEISLRQQLDAQLAHYDTLLKEILFREKGRPIAGELENDVDDAVQLNALRSQLDDSLGTIKSLQNSVVLSDGELGALRGRLKEQENEIEALKRRLDAPPIILAPPSVPIQEVPPQSCQETVISGPPAVLVPAKVPYAAAPVASEVLEPIVEEELPDELSESDVVTILLTCPGLDEVECILPRDLNPDDLVFELRKAVANAFGCPLGRASLLLGEAAVIMLGGDVDASFTPAAAAELAYGGALTFRIATGKLVTNAQLDAVAKSFESPHVSSPDLAASMGGARGTWGQGMQQVTRRSWSSQELETEDAGDAQLRDLRNELESTMSQVSDSEYLSAEEAESKMSRLRASQRRLKSELSSHLDDYKRSFSRVLSDAEDSGAEERHNSESKGEGGTLRLLQRGGYTGANTSKSIESLRSVYSSRSIDSFNRRGDNDEDDDDGSSVLMRSLMSPLKPSKPTKASHGTKSAHLDLASSVVILPGTQMLTGMNSSESSSAVNSKATTAPQSYKPRYGSQREGDYEGEDYEENKSSGRLSAKQLDRSGPEKESGMTAVGTRTTSSAISDLTSSGLQSSARSRKLSQTQGSDVMSHVSSDDLSGSSRTRKSTDLSRQTDNTPAERRDSYKAEPSKLLKQSMSVSERSVASRTPTSLSPNNEMNEEDGDESLALSESNDAFPFLEEESIEGSSRSTRK